MATKSEVTKWLRKLQKGWSTSPDLSRETVDIWSEALTKYPLEILVAAAPVLAQREKWFPNSLSQIFSVCDEIMGKDRAIPTAGEAWDELRSQMARVGANGIPTVSHDAVLNACRAVGGWRYLCLSDNYVSDRARFFEVYADCRDRAQRQENMPELSQRVAQKYLGQLQAEAKKLKLAK